MIESHLGFDSRRDSKSKAIPFKGEIIATPELLGTAIAARVGLEYGTFHEDAAGWLVFDFEGKTLLVGKRAFSHSITWNQLNAVGIVFGEQSIDVHGSTYIVRVLRGAATNPTIGGNGTTDPSQSWGSEWNQLFYPLVPNPSDAPTYPVSQEGITYGSWASYTEADLGIGTYDDFGSYGWCQEGPGGPLRVSRGSRTCYFYMSLGSLGTPNYGWRPVLELVRDTEEPQDLFLGEVPTSQLIDGETLASELGLTAGIAHNANEPWLQFLTREGQVIYVAKKSYRHSLSWDHINAVDAVYGERVIEIGVKQFRVRLMKGVSSDPVFQFMNSLDPEESWDSEWNRLMYRLVSEPTGKPASGISGEGITYGAFANYAETALNIGGSGGDGRYSWCQETDETDGRVLRGGTSISLCSLYPPTYTNSNYGWRPVLELIS